jgi:DNA-binding transcriptional LysR family regulator
VINGLNFRTLDLNLLRVFDEVMTERSLTRAANNLAMTQPAVSNALRRLREVLGDELVRRSGYGVEPTPVALALWPTVRDALHMLRESLAPGTFDPATARNAFVLAMADATAAKLIPGLMDLFESEAPGANLRVLPLTTRDPRSLLESGTVDLAIGHFPGVLAELGAMHLQENDPHFHHQRLYDGEYVVVMRRGHPLAGGPLSLDSYCDARHLLVSFSGRPFGFVDEALAAVSRQRRVVITVNQFFTAGRVVATTDLLTVLPRHFVGATGMEDELALCDLPLQVPAVHVDSLWHRQATQNTAHRWLRDTVARAANTDFRPAPAPPPPRA